MKLVVCILVVLPLALCAPLSAEEEDFDKRFFLDSLHLPSTHDLGKELLSLLGSDTSEAACEAACPTALNALVPGAGLVGGFLCDPACHWVQAEVQG